MTIIIDNSELRSTSRMPIISGAKTSKILEALTGADVMVSTKSFPANTPAQITKHIQAGAILIQFKFGSDLISSITDERVNIALARMLEAGTRHQYQRMIISCGMYLPDLSTGKTLVGKVVKQSNGKVVIVWRDTQPEIEYRALATVRRRIAMRGGVFSNLTCDAEVPGELVSMESDLKFLSGQPIKSLLHLKQFPPDPPDPDDPLQLPVEVKDWRRVIAGFRGIGPKRAGDLWGALLDHNAETAERHGRPVEGDGVEPTLMQAFAWITKWLRGRGEIFPRKAHGWGKGTIKSVREQLGMCDGMELNVRVAEGEPEVKR